jgi:hypothetical protein
MYLAWQILSSKMKRIVCFLAGTLLIHEPKLAAAFAEWNGASKILGLLPAAPYSKAGMRLQIRLSGRKYSESCISENRKMHMVFLSSWRQENSRRSLGGRWRGYRLNDRIPPRGLFQRVCREASELKN